MHFLKINGRLMGESYDFFFIEGRVVKMLGDSRERSFNLFCISDFISFFHKKIKYFRLNIISLEYVMATASSWCLCLCHSFSYSGNECLHTLRGYIAQSLCCTLTLPMIIEKHCLILHFKLFGTVMWGNMPGQCNSGIMRLVCL